MEVNGFTVMGELGKGAFGTVYRATKSGQGARLDQILADLGENFPAEY